MLYHLIQLNPNKDITLHVSANNPAMVCVSSPHGSLADYASLIVVVQPLWIQGRGVRGGLLPRLS